MRRSVLAHFFGEIAALDRRPRSASVAALSGCAVAAMSSKTFADLVDNTPAIATKLIHRFCHIIRVSDDRIMDVSTMRSVQRVCQELMRLSGGTVIHPLPNQGEIAGLASTTRETVGRVFHELTAAGIIERKQRALYIRDRARLERLIGNLDLEGTFDTVFHPKGRSVSA